MRRTALVLVALAGLAVMWALLSTTALAAEDPLPGTGGVAINGGAASTAMGVVTVSLPFPSGSIGLVRLSNDGISWSQSRPWEQSLSWDLTDPTTGGSAVDGHKTVRVRWSDGSGTWSDVGQDTILLDTTPPEYFGEYSPFCNYQGGWVLADYCLPQLYDEGGLGVQEFRLDGGPWTLFTERVARSLDFRTLRWGGGWTTEQRELCWRATDATGNVAAPLCQARDLSIPDSQHYDIRFEFPRPAVTGQLFTIRPVFPPDFPTPPGSALCEWQLRWGDDGKLFELPNENFGSVWLHHLYHDGGCNEWTFTLPYTPGLTYNFSLNVYSRWFGEHYGGTHGGSPTVDVDVTTFYATVGTTQRGIPKSTLGLAYLLPDKLEIRAGQPVTYTLFASEGYTLPCPGWFWAVNHATGTMVGDDSPTCSKTFTFTPTEEGSWQAGWTWEDPNTHEYHRAEFDPPADKTAPRVSAPQARVTPAGTVDAKVPVELTWRASDPTVKGVSSGLARTQLQLSRNGGAWKNVTLPSARATSVRLNLATTGTYRYRVRAIDDVGNRSTWATGPTLRPRLWQQTKAVLTGQWATVTGTQFSGSSAVTSKSFGARARLAFSGRGVAWVANVGPGAGLAQVWIDGSLAATIDLSAAQSAHRRVVYTRSWTSLRDHVIEIRNLGTFGRPVATVDAFVLIK